MQAPIRPFSFTNGDPRLAGQFSCFECRLKGDNVHDALHRVGKYQQTLEDFAGLCRFRCDGTQLPIQADRLLQPRLGDR